MSDRELRRREMGLGLQEDVDITTLPEGRAVEAAPVKEPTTPIEWIQQNLFSSWLNGTLTLLSLALILFVGINIIRFIFVSAEWNVIQANVRGYMIGGFPIEEVWRIWVSAYLVAVLAGFSLGSSQWRFRPTPRRLVLVGVATFIAVGLLLFVTDTTTVVLLTLGLPAAVVAGSIGGRPFQGPRVRRLLVIAWILAFPVIMFVIRGFDGVPPRLWGGFFFNIIAATVGIFASFPIGILLALGRRSTFPVMRVFCVGFIELFRGVPLVAWLIFSKYVVDLMLPPQMDLPDIIKAFVVMTLFSAAYIGEIVRGGLQGVHSGQYEAAKALGLPTTRMMALIVLPQALRATIPAMISHFISLFKDTALFVAIEVTDLLAAAQRSAASLDFLGQDTETLLFAALIFWVVAFSMSRWSQRLEVRLGVGQR